MRITYGLAAATWPRSRRVIQRPARMTRMQNLRRRDRLRALCPDSRRDPIRSLIAAVLAVIIAFGAPTSGCGSAASDFGTDGARTRASRSTSTSASLTGLIGSQQVFPDGASVAVQPRTSWAIHPHRDGRSEEAQQRTSPRSPLAGALAEVHRRTSSLSPRVGRGRRISDQFRKPIPVHR